MLQVSCVGGPIPIDFLFYIFKNIQICKPVLHTAD